MSSENHQKVQGHSLKVLRTPSETSYKVLKRKVLRKVLENLQKVARNPSENSQKKVPQKIFTKSPKGSRKILKMSSESSQKVPAATAVLSQCHCLPLFDKF